MKRKKPPEWFRWVNLVMAAFAPFAGWMDFRDYRRYAYGMFSEEEWAKVMAGFQFRWAILGILSACFLYNFFTFDVDRRGHRLPDEVFNTALLLFWACLPLLISLSGSILGIWCVVLIVLTVVTGRSWMEYFGLS